MLETIPLFFPFSVRKHQNKLNKTVKKLRDGSGRRAGAVVVGRSNTTKCRFSTLCSGGCAPSFPDQGGQPGSNAPSGKCTCVWTNCWRRGGRARVKVKSRSKMWRWFLPLRPWACPVSKTLRQRVGSLGLQQVGKHCDLPSKLPSSLHFVPF